MTNKLYTLWLLAAFLIGASFTSKADVTATVTWDIPGSVIIYLGSQAEKDKVTLPEGATSYTGTITGQDYGYMYVRAASGYILKNAVCEEDGAVINPASWGTPQITVNMDEYNHGGHTVKVNCGVLEYDGEIEIDFVSAGNVTATFSGTSREITLDGGVQTVAFSKEYEENITFSANVKGAVDPYIKQNGNLIGWEQKYSWDTVLKHDDIFLSDGDKFEVKWNDEEPVISGDISNYTVTLDYENPEAKDAINLIFNVTQSSSIYERDSFEVKENDVVRINFNTKDYSVYVDNKYLEPNPDNSSTSWESAPVTSDITISIAVTDRKYDTTSVKVSVTNVEGLVAHKETMDGETVDFSALQPERITFLGTDYDTYTIEVSEKSPKVFVEAAEGWWLQECVTGTKASDLTETRMATPAQPLYVKTHKVERAQKMAVNVVLGDDNGGSMADFTLRSAQREEFPLHAGMNVVAIDALYDAPFTVAPVGINLFDDAENGVMADDFTVYHNYSVVKLDDETLTFSGIAAQDGSVIYIFDKRKALPLYTVSVRMADEADGSVVMYDEVKEVAGEKFSAFQNSSVVVTPVAGQKVKVDGKEVELTNGSYVFTVSGNHAIEIGEVAAVTEPTDYLLMPGNGEAVEKVEAITLQFPYAESVALSAGMKWSDAYLAVGNKEISMTGEIMTDGEMPSVVFTPEYALTEEAEYNFYLDKGFFTINGNLKSEEIDAFFTVTGAVANPAEMVITPADGSVVESVEYFLVEFPNAATAEFVGDPTEIIFKSLDNNWANWGWTIEEADMEHPAFTITPNYQATQMKSYQFFISENLFLVDGSVYNSDVSVVFSIHKEINPSDLDYAFAPEEGDILNDGEDVYLTVLFSEDFSVRVNTENVKDFSVKLGEKELEYFSEWDYRTESNFFSVNIKGEALAGYTGALSLYVKEGALSISGAESPEIFGMWNLVAPRDYEVEAFASFEDTKRVEPGEEITVEVMFVGADKGEVFNEYFIHLEEDNYDAGRYYATPTSIEEGGSTLFGTLPVQRFVITFPPVDTEREELTLKFTMYQGAFLLDGVAESPEYIRLYDYIHVGVGSLDVDEGDGTVTVVTPDGKILMIDSPATRLEELPRGLYIINGKKILK